MKIEGHHAPGERVMAIGWCGHRDGCRVLIEIEESARRIGPSLVASVCETAKRANQPAVHRER